MRTNPLCFVFVALVLCWLASCADARRQPQQQPLFQQQQQQPLVQQQQQQQQQHMHFSEQQQQVLQQLRQRKQTLFPSTTPTPPPTPTPTPTPTPPTNQFWTLQGTQSEGNVKVVSGVHKPYSAIVSLADGLNATGWGVLEIWASRDVSDEDQMFAMGFLEGYVTAKHIVLTLTNILAEAFQNTNTTPPHKLTDFFNTQETWAKSQIAANQNDPFWVHVGYLFSQYEGLEAGYAQAVQDSNSELQNLPHWAFQILNGFGDLPDIMLALFTELGVDWTTLDRYEAEDKHSAGGMCSVLLKVTGNYSDLFFSHSTWFSYSNTDRIFKTYHTALNNSATAAQTVSFSSYPGMLESLDDFYMMSSGLGMVQTTNQVINLLVYRHVHPESLLAWQRVRVASMVAHSGEEWYNAFRTHFSGTYANQYMVVDFNVFEPNAPLKSNLLWVVEEMPGLIVGADQSSALKLGYWASYNIPFYPEVFLKSGYGVASKLFGNFFTYELCPRAEIFRRDQGSVNDLESLKQLMRSNKYLTDPFSFDGREQNPTYAICARGDLGRRHSTHGCYDTKVSSYRFGAKYLRAQIMSGPTTNEGSLPAFSWLPKPFDKKPHLGLPSVYNFDFIQVEPSEIPEL